MPPWKRDFEVLACRMPRYPGSQDPSELSSAEYRALIARAIDSLKRVDRRCLETLISSGYVDDAFIHASTDKSAGPNAGRLTLYLRSDKGPVLLFLEGGELFTVEPYLQQQRYHRIRDFSEMKEAVKYFKMLCDESALRFR